MTDKLSLYNKALLYCSEAPLAGLEDDTTARRVLDAVWDDGALRKILEEGFWNNAIRTLELAAEPGIEPPFGRRFAFVQPDDFVRVVALCQDEFLRAPLLDYVDEAGHWYADIDRIFVSFVSDDAAYGGDLSRWPPSLAEAGARWLASVAAHGFNKAEAQIQRMEAAAFRAFSIARNRDAMNQPTRFAPPGAWLRARAGRAGRYGARSYDPAL